MKICENNVSFGGVLFPSGVVISESMKNVWFNREIIAQTIRSQMISNPVVMTTIGTTKLTFDIAGRIAAQAGYHYDEVTYTASEDEPPSYTRPAFDVTPIAGDNDAEYEIKGPATALGYKAVLSLFNTDYPSGKFRLEYGENGGTYLVEFDTNASDLSKAVFIPRLSPAKRAVYNGQVTATAAASFVESTEDLMVVAEGGSTIKIQGENLVIKLTPVMATEAILDTITVMDPKAVGACWFTLTC